jgi:uncharacterized protein YciI
MLRLIAVVAPFALTLGFLASPVQEKKPAEKAPPPAAEKAGAKAPAEIPHGVRAWHVQMELGPKFDPKVPPTSQPGFEDHVKNVQALAGDGTLLLGGPIFESADSEKMIGGVMIVKAKDEKAIREKFANDPFFTGGIVKIASVHPMMIGMGAWMPKEKEAAGH